jgi:ATP dependent DNA ligase domain
VPFEGLVHSGDAAPCMVFDCLYLEGRDLLDMPLRERRAELERALETTRSCFSRPGGWRPMALIRGSPTGKKALDLEPLSARSLSRAGGVLEVRGYVRVRGIRRSRATRRRSRRAANFSTARRAARATQPIRSASVASVAPMEGP